MKIFLIALAFASSAGVATQARADFSGTNDPAQWTVANTNGGNGSALASAAMLQLTSSNFTNFDDAPLDPSTLTFSKAFGQATTVSFHWAYVTQDDNGSSNDTFGYGVGADAIQLSINGSYAPQSGNVTLQVNAGQLFSFRSTSTDSLFGSAVTTITAFDAVSSVPEPDGLGLALLGLAGLGAACRRRRSISAHGAS